MSKFNDYINSGMLEAYCMGVVSGSEIKEVEEFCLQNSSAQKEIESIQYTLEQYATSYQLTPPSSIKKELMSRIDKLESKEKKNTKRRRQM